MKIPSQIRYFNKYVLNHLLGRIARSAWGPFTIVRHVGRRSGKVYETPIIAIPGDGFFIIALTYGPDVDWYKNVIAAGKCELLWHRQNYKIDKIESLERERGLAYFPKPESTILRLIGIQDFIRMQYRLA